jgi:foldase protein PrsA
LEKAGVSEREMMGRVRGNLLEAKVREEIAERATTVSAREIADYYRRNRTALAVPDRRDLRLVITKSPGRAEAARAALEAGRSWKSVAREYSLHFSRHEGGRIENARKGTSEDGLGAVIFGASPGDLVGPVKDDDTWAVFVVERIKPSYQPTLEQARHDIVEHLQSAREDQAFKAYTEKYRDMTTCATGFIVPACKNGPEEMEGERSA